MDKYSIAGKLVAGVVIAIIVNKITPHVEEALDQAVANVKFGKTEK